MPIANVRGVNLNYQVLGDHGPWVALSPGGRRDMSGIEEVRRLLVTVREGWVQVSAATSPPPPRP